MVNTLYLGGAGTASLDMRDDGNIIGIGISCTNAAAGSLEVSFNSSSSFTTNDTTGVIGAQVLDGVGSGGQMTYLAMKEPVSVGERVFLHLSGANIARVLIFTDTAAARPATRRR